MLLPDLVQGPPQGSGMGFRINWPSSVMVEGLAKISLTKSRKEIGLCKTYFQFDSDLKSYLPVKPYFCRNTLTESWKDPEIMMISWFLARLLINPSIP